MTYFGVFFLLFDLICAVFVFTTYFVATQSLIKEKGHLNTAEMVTNRTGWLQISRPDRTMSNNGYDTGDTTLSKPCNIVNTIFFVCKVYHHALKSILAWFRDLYIRLYSIHSFFREGHYFLFKNHSKEFKVIISSSTSACFNFSFFEISFTWFTLCQSFINAKTHLYCRIKYPNLCLIDYTISFNQVQYKYLL